MQQIDNRLADLQTRLTRHRLFHRLERDPEFEHVQPVIATLAFWVTVFQDILRINEVYARGDELHHLIECHMHEDAGHHRWYVADCLRLFGKTPDYLTLFGREHQTTRDTSYALMSEVFRCGGAVERLVLVRALEAAGHVFFDVFSRYLARAGRAHTMDYFSYRHLEVEHDHEMFEDETRSYISRLELSDTETAQCIALVDRVFGAFGVMFDGLERVLGDSQQRAVPQAIPMRVTQWNQGSTRARAECLADQRFHAARAERHRPPGARPWTANKPTS